MRDEFWPDTCRGAGFEEALLRADAFMRRAGVCQERRSEPRPEARGPVVLPVDYQIPTFLRRGYKRPD